MNHEYRRVLYFKLITWLAEVEGYTIKFPYSEEQPHNDFFKKIFAVGQNFYAALESRQVLLLLLGEIRDNGSRPLSDEEQSIDDFFMENQLKNKVYSNQINRTVVIEMWTAFESSLYELARQYFNDNFKEYFQEVRVRSILKCLDNSNLHSGDIEKLKKKFRVNEISKLDIPYLVQKVFKYLCFDYSRNKVEDSQFLSSVGRFRNLIHNSFVNKGPDFHFDLNEFTYSFPHNGGIQLVDRNSEQRVDDIMGFPYLINELIAIWIEIISTIKKQPNSVCPPALKKV